MRGRIEHSRAILFAKQKLSRNKSVLDKVVSEKRVRRSSLELLKPLKIGKKSRQDWLSASWAEHVHFNIDRASGLQKRRPLFSGAKGIVRLLLALLTLFWQRLVNSFESEIDNKILLWFTGEQHDSFSHYMASLFFAGIIVEFFDAVQYPNASVLLLG